MPPTASAASSSRSRPGCPGVQICEHLPRIAGGDGQGRGDPLDRRPARRALELAERHRLPDGPGPARGQAQLRVGDRAGAGPGRPGRARRSSTCRRSCSTSRTTAPGRASSAHSYKPARMEGDDLALLDPPADVPPPRFDRRKALLGQFDRVPPLASTTPRSAAWTASTAGPSTC